MKKMLIAMTAVMFATTSAFAATTTFGQWADNTAKKINAKEAAAREAEQKAKQQAAQKKLETKKQQWNQLIGK